MRIHKIHRHMWMLLRSAGLLVGWKRHTKRHFSIDITRQLDSCEIDRYCCNLNTHGNCHAENSTRNIQQIWHGKAKRNELNWKTARIWCADDNRHYYVAFMQQIYMIVSKFRLSVYCVLFCLQRNRCHVEYISIGNVKDVSAVWISRNWKLRRCRDRAKAKMVFAKC